MDRVASKLTASQAPTSSQVTERPRPPCYSVGLVYRDKASSGVSPRHTETKWHLVALIEACPEQSCMRMHVTTLSERRVLFSLNGAGIANTPKERDLNGEDELMLQCGVCRRVLLCHAQIIRLSYARTTIVRSCKHIHLTALLDTDKDSFIMAP